MEIKNVPYLTRSFKVPSRSNKGAFHIVELHSDGLFCNCVAGSYSKNCYHKKLIQRFLDKKKNEG